MRYTQTLISALLCSILALPVMAAPGGSSWSRTDKLSAVQNHLDAKEYRAAVAKLERIVAQDANNADAYNLLGYSNRKLKYYEKAETYYRRALELDPGHKGAMEYLGELYVETDRMAEAEAMLSRLNDACFFSCSEYRQLQQYIERKNSGQAVRSNW
ncbi:MAG: tetratricopeptide repeat protein [Pseudomonadota bacterium]|mgnify:CR=1 FL=1|nr:tetratricopeptide repeat protein [Pseudomonadota bacterium]